MGLGRFGERVYPCSTRTLSLPEDGSEQFVGPPHQFLSGEDVMTERRACEVKGAFLVQDAASNGGTIRSIARKVRACREGGAS